jgi:hypothetical protein
LILYTPYIGKTRWPRVESAIRDAAHRGVEVVLLHKPLTDDAWQSGDARWGAEVLASLAHAGVTLVPVSGVHAKTIVVDGRIVYEGSLNWASQTSTYEHMLRIESADVASLLERMMQLRDLIDGFKTHESSVCPKCGSPLVVVNQRKLRPGESQPLKFACAAYQRDRKSCGGYMRNVNQRAPFTEQPLCSRGRPMILRRTKTGKPWEWRCEHGSCPRPRWLRGDTEDA